MRMNAAEKRVASRWVPKGSTELQAPEINAVVYLYDARNGNPCAVMYSGTKGKSDSHVEYHTAEARLKAVNEWRKSMAEHLKWKAEHKAQRNKPHDLPNGTIFLFTWGYDQTNLNFYQVVNSTAHTVNVREIAQKNIPDGSGLPKRMPGSIGGYGSMSDHRVAVKDEFIGDEIRKKIQFSGDKPYLSMASYGWCGIWDGTPHYCSWYH